MGRTASDEKLQVVPGLEGPRWLTNDSWVTMSRTGGGIGSRLKVEYDDDLRRYVCTEFTVRRDPDADEGRGYVTTEAIRAVTLGHLVAISLLNLPDLQVTRELPNPDNIEPWGWSPPDGLSKEGPTDRALQWVAHLYHLGMALSQNPAKVVEDNLKLSHGTASRWVRLARQKGYLGPSEGPGRAAG